MKEIFKRDLQALKQLDKFDLYKEFHKIQLNVLRPQMEAHFRFLVGEIVHDRVLELFGPQSPEISESYTSEIMSKISEAREKEILFLNNALDFVSDPMKILQLAKDARFRVIVIQGFPKDSTFKYESYPKVKYFTKREKFILEKHLRESGDIFFDQILGGCELFGWKVVSDSRLDFNYLTDFQKISAIKLEIGLDLIEHKFGGSPSNFDIIVEDLQPWYFHTDSFLRMKGCSRWLILNLIQ